MPSIEALLPTPAEAGSPAQRTLLQVEDNAENAEIVSQLIARRADLRLMTATSGQQGIEMACAFTPELILMDMMMPGLGGLATIALLRGNPTTADIPVIVLSSNVYSSEIKKKDLTVRGILDHEKNVVYINVRVPESTVVRNLGSKE